MPELPEVQALAAHLRHRAVGRTVAAVHVVAVAVLKTYDPLPQTLVGAAADRVDRFGKFLDVRFAAGEAAPVHLVVHLARAGWLRWRDDVPTAPPRRGKGPLALRLVFDDGSGFDLTEAGTQKRLAVYLVRDPAEIGGVAALGPDPLDPAFTPAALKDLLAAQRTRIKGLLRDQRVLAGIGNAYSDEILHVARMSPFTIADRLTPEQVATLHEAIVTTLTTAWERAAAAGAGELKAEKRAGLRVHGRTGEPCPVCGDTIREVSFADSALQYCPTCQTGGKPLADRRLSRLLK